MADEHMPSDNEIENYEDWFDDESNISTECKNKKPKIKEIESDVIKRRYITDEGTTSKSNIVKKEENITTVDDPQTEVLKVISKRLADRESINNEDDVFGKMVAAELKSLPKRLKFRFKHEINNSIYKFQEVNFQEMENQNQFFYQPGFVGSSNSVCTHTVLEKLWLV